MTTSPLAFLRATLDAAEELAQRAAAGHTLPHEEHVEPERRGMLIWPLPSARARYKDAATGKWDDPDRYAGLTLIEANSPAAVLRRIAADRKLIELHAPEWRTVEWPHDENGKGEAQVCPTCQHADFTHWSPYPGEAGVLPEGFIAPYVLAPCATLRALAEGWGWTEEAT